VRRGSAYISSIGAPPPEASLIAATPSFSPRDQLSRKEGFDYLKIALPAAVQKMVRADKAFAVDSISVSPDRSIKTEKIVAKAERK